MARDYKSRAHPPRKPQKQQKPGWVWFVAGLLVGVFISGLAWLKATPSGPLFPQQAATKKQDRIKQPVAQKKEEKEQDTPKPRFDFYTILPEMEVVVPDPVDELKNAKVETKGVAETTITSSKDASVGYMLQMGSFRKYGDADRLKASLALVGIQAEIQKVNIKGGDVFHRVRSGPYDRVQVNALRAKLKQKKISSLVIKYRK
jgi:cell division protein FtsN